MELTQQQKDILYGQVCPYCKSKSELVDSKVVYGTSYGMMYLCKPCDAYVGCHEGTDKSKGRLANKALRQWKMEAHKYFDEIWKSKTLKRKQAYAWLSKELDIPSKYTHIGMFSVKTCKEVVRVSKEKLNDKT